MTTNTSLNFVKMLLSLTLIFVASAMYGSIEFYGLEIVAYLAFVLSVGWFHRIKFLGVPNTKCTLKKLSLRTNMFGDCLVDIETDSYCYSSSTRTATLKGAYDFIQNGNLVKISGLTESPMKVNISIEKLNTAQ